MDETNSIQSLVPSPQVRYIKLGQSGAWLGRCLADNLLELGHCRVPHGVSLNSDWSKAQQIYEEAGVGRSKAKDFVREIRDFYTLGADDIWVTIGDGRLFWGMAEAEVFAVTGEDRGCRARRIKWSDRDLQGNVLSAIDSVLAADQGSRLSADDLPDRSAGLFTSPD